MNARVQVQVESDIDSIVGMGRHRQRCSVTFSIILGSHLIVLSCVDLPAVQLVTVVSYCLYTLLAFHTDRMHVFTTLKSQRSLMPFLSYLTITDKKELARLLHAPDKGNNTTDMFPDTTQICISCHF